MKHFKKVSNEQEFNNYINSDNFAEPNYTKIGEELEFNDEYVIVRYLVEGDELFDRYSPYNFLLNCIDSAFKNGKINEVSYITKGVFNISEAILDNKFDLLYHVFNNVQLSEPIEDGWHFVKIKFKDNIIHVNQDEKIDGIDYTNACPIFCLGISGIKQNEIYIPNNIIGIGSQGLTGLNISKLILPDSFSADIYNSIRQTVISSVYMTSLYFNIDTDLLTDDSLNTWGIYGHTFPLNKIIFGNKVKKLTNAMITPWVNTIKEIDCNYVTRISDGLFYNCAQLTKVTLGNLTLIPLGAFMNCTALTHLDIPDSVTYIAHGAFQGCISLDDETKQRILEIQPDYQGW